VGSSELQLDITAEAAIATRKLLISRDEECARIG
jgi:hypothetical protein